MPSTDFTKPTKISTNWGGSDIDTTSAGNLLIQIGDVLLLQNGSNVLLQ